MKLSLLKFGKRLTTKVLAEGGCEPSAQWSIMAGAVVCLPLRFAEKGGGEFSVYRLDMTAAEARKLVDAAELAEQLERDHKAGAA